MKIKSIILPLFAVFVLAFSPAIAVASDANGVSTVYGGGFESCAKFLKNEKEEKISELVYLSWIQGFMSAAGRYNDTEKKFGKDGAGVDIDGIMHLVREYCKKNPLKPLVYVAEYVAEQLINRAGRR